MDLKNCALEIDRIRSASPFVRLPREDWQNAKNENLIPFSLFQFYCLNNYFSLFSAPSSLRDPTHILFSHLEMLVNSIKFNFETSKQEATELEYHLNRTYNPVKKSKGESWDKDAGKKANAALKRIVLANFTILDLLSEVVALFFPGMITNQQLGKSQAQSIKEFLKVGYEPPGKIVSPQEHILKELHDRLCPAWEESEDEEEWFEYLLMLRNKFSHYDVFDAYRVNLHSKEKEPKFYAFLSNSWPAYFQEHVNLPGQKTDGISMPAFLLDNLIHEDVLSYSKGLVKKNFKITQIIFEELNKHYEIIKDGPLLLEALGALNRNRMKCKFKKFKTT